MRTLQQSWTCQAVYSLLISHWNYNIRPNNDVKPKRRNAANCQICYGIITFSVSVLSSRWMKAPQKYRSMSDTKVWGWKISESKPVNLGIRSFKIDTFGRTVNINIVAVEHHNQPISAYKLWGTMDVEMAKSWLFSKNVGKSFIKVHFHLDLQPVTASFLPFMFSHLDASQNTVLLYCWHFRLGNRRI